MADAPSDLFSHRHNANGTHDSICRRCYATIATEHDQDDLLAQEAGHVCEEKNLQRLRDPKAWLERLGIQSKISQQEIRR